MVEAKSKEVDLINMTDEERAQFVKKKYYKWQLIMHNHLKKIVNKHRTWTVSKYLDMSIPHLDLILLTKIVELQPSDLKFHYTACFPRTEDDYRYLASLGQKQITSMKDMYRKKDDVTLGFSMQYSDGREVKLGSAGDKQTGMRFTDTIWKV